jgi:cell division protein FtsZ
MREIEEAAALVQQQAHEDANVIFGAAIDENMGDLIKVTVIATGFDLLDGDAPAATAITTTPASTQRPALRGTPAPSVGREAPATIPTGSLTDLARQQVGRQRPALSSDAFPSRRSSPPDVRAAAGPPSGERPATRERSSFVPPLDADWDTPAYQRRGQ